VILLGLEYLKLVPVGKFLNLVFILVSFFKNRKPDEIWKLSRLGGSEEMPFQKNKQFIFPHFKGRGQSPHPPFLISRILIFFWRIFKNAKSLNIIYKLGNSKLLLKNKLDIFLEN
jgi:hypothetical protein